ncbi:helix-turn-helix domain-containing protein [Lepagella muris]|jgi:excisionase family DNA binding protein|uniref:DNA-binding protein n=1 Tax=Lepagella muris TaxID=3032870 RepID=A0AC61RG52_9BACT|nr:helix-turn-helix domain-containing protein [Lepagella muris]ROT08343.1 DNA-binding protein [Muribaculaceae bacterium Isolate-037 (Harlan)]TGY79801.1 DNA-binding protein [Lepagella muris]THG51795.1 helix-turn-helix domain-containing protein [Bacteroidales bacterium]TKC54419.1 helix-turn-helix domain-containing protein [Bacteroidales bacterium]
MSIDERLERIETLVSINAKEVLTVKEVSLLIGRSESRIRHLVADREIPHYKNDRGQVNFRRSEIEAWQLGERIPTRAETDSKAATYIVTKRMKKAR